jgi:hypothetical protein
MSVGNCIILLEGAGNPVRIQSRAQRSHIKQLFYMASPFQEIIKSTNFYIPFL